MFEKLAQKIEKNQSMLFHWLLVWFLIGLNLGFSFLIRGIGFTIVQNTSPIGFTFGYGSSLLLLGFITYYLISSKIIEKSPILAVLILGGAWSNLIEKLVFDSVADYIDLGFSTLNLADVQIVLGVLFLNLQFWFGGGYKSIKNKLQMEESQLPK